MEALMIVFAVTYAVTMAPSAMWTAIGAGLLVLWGCLESLGRWLETLDWHFIVMAYLVYSVWSSNEKANTKLAELRQEIRALRPFELPKRNGY